MIEFTNKESIDRIRRFTIFVRSEGDFQYSILEASIFSWTDNWMVIPIEGSGLSQLKFDYPNWLHNLYQAFGPERAESKTTLPSQSYRRLESNKDIRVYKDIDKMRSELKWSPEGQCQSAKSWLAVYVPAGRVTLMPFAFKFSKQGRNDFWVPMLGKADNCRVFFQTGHPHLESPDYEDKDWVRSQYQACIFTRTKLTKMMVDPMQDYHRWIVPKTERTSQWMTLKK